MIFSEYWSRNYVEEISFDLVWGTIWVFFLFWYWKSSVTQNGQFSGPDLELPAFEYKAGFLPNWRQRSTYFGSLQHRLANGYELHYVLFLRFLRYLDWILSLILRFILLMRTSRQFFLPGTKLKKEKCKYDRTFIGLKGNCKNKLLRVKLKLLFLSLSSSSFI